MTKPNDERINKNKPNQSFLHQFQSKKDSEKESIEVEGLQQCSVCGRVCTDQVRVCHPPDRMKSERELATKSDLQILIYSAFNDRPVSWIESVYNRGDDESNPLFVALDASKELISEFDQEPEPVSGLLHLTLLYQYDLIPHFSVLSSNVDLRRVCSEYYGVKISQEQVEQSPYIVRRRVDRRKVYSTTREFRKRSGLLLCNWAEHLYPYILRKPFIGDEIVDDHTDHNIVCFYAKEHLKNRSDVDWVSTPHSVRFPTDWELPLEQYPFGFDRSELSKLDPRILKQNLRQPVSGEQLSIDPSHFPLLSFDFAGFKSTDSGESLEFLGVVIDEDSLEEILFQIKEIKNTDATGIVIMRNQNEIRTFIDRCRFNGFLPDFPVSYLDPTRYHLYKHLTQFHQDFLCQIPLFENIVFLTRRKVIEGGLRDLDQFVEIMAND